MKTLPFAIAVLSKIKDKEKNNQSFSFFDIAKELREDVNNGVLFFNDRNPEKIEVDGVDINSFKVEREDVKNVVNCLVGNKLIPFEKAISTSCGVSFVCFNPVAQKPTVTPNTTNKVLTATTTITKTIRPACLVSKDSILKYIKSRGEVSLKKIQSAFKGKPLTVSEIYSSIKDDVNEIWQSPKDQKFSYLSKLVVKLK